MPLDYEVIEPERESETDYELLEPERPQARVFPTAQEIQQGLAGVSRAANLADTAVRMTDVARQAGEIPAREFPESQPSGVTNPNAGIMPDMTATTRGGPQLRPSGIGSNSFLRQAQEGIMEIPSALAGFSTAMAEPVAAGMGIEPEESMVGITPEMIPTGKAISERTGVPEIVTTPASGVGRALAGFGTFLTSPVGGVEMALAAVPGIGLLQRGKFVVDMAGGAGESAGRLYSTIERISKKGEKASSEDWQQMAEDTAAGLLMLLGAGKIASHEFSRITGVRAPLGRVAESTRTRLAKDLAQELLKSEMKSSAPSGRALVQRLPVNPASTPPPGYRLDTEQGSRQAAAWERSINEAIKKPTIQTPQPTGAPNAIPIREPAPLPVGETPRSGQEVGTRIPESEKPAVPQEVVQPLPAEKPGGGPAETVTEAKAPPKIPTIPPQKGERLVEVVRPDGTSYIAAFSDQYYDFTKLGKGKIPSIAVEVNGGWSHGAAKPGEVIRELPKEKIPKTEPLETDLDYGEGGEMPKTPAVGFPEREASPNAPKEPTTPPLQPTKPIVGEPATATVGEAEMWYHDATRATQDVLDSGGLRGGSESQASRGEPFTKPPKKSGDVDLIFSSKESATPGHVNEATGLTVAWLSPLKLTDPSVDILVRDSTGRMVSVKDAYMAGERNAEKLKELGKAKLQPTTPPVAEPPAGKPAEAWWPGKATRATHEIPGTPELANPELVARGINIGNDVAIPVGGLRKSGAIGNGGYSKRQAEQALESIFNKPGFPDARIRFNKSTQGYGVEWGDPIDWTSGHRNLGKQFGYRPEDVEAYSTAQGEAAPAVPGEAKAKEAAAKFKVGDFDKLALDYVITHDIPYDPIVLNSVKDLPPAARSTHNSEIQRIRKLVFARLGLKGDTKFKPDLENATSALREAVAKREESLGNKPPQLRPGEKGTGELLQGEDAPFNLAGEKGVDVERIAAEKKAKEDAAKAAEKFAEENQREMFDDPENVVREGDPFSKIKPRREKFDPFTAEEGDLADFFEERFGEQTRGSGVAGEARGVPAFRDYTEFRDWMEKAYAAADLDALKTGFALADTKQKIQFIKDNRAADAIKREVIAHLATGAPLPAGFKPVAPAAPRPTPGAAGTTPPARPGQPPTPPRPSPNTPRHRKFDITALTQLFRQFGKFPVVNERLMRAYGRFVPGTKAVELKARLMWDTKLAERVLGHEIGHFIDLAVQVMGKGKQFAKRLVPLWDLRRQVWTKTELKNEARDLSREWRGPFTNGDRYRDSATELFADVMSAMFNNPEMVNQKYPKLFDAFQQLREGKPQFASAYREIETWLQGDTMVNELRVQDRAAVNRTFDELQNPRQPSKPSFRDRLMFATVSLWDRAFQKEGKPRKMGESVADELEYNKTWAAKENALWTDDFSKQVRPELERVNSDPVQARADLLSYSKAVRTIGERRAAGKWIEDNPVEARQLLEKVLDESDTLRSKFANDLSRATDAQLYDLSAAIFREIHDGGERFVNRMSGVIDEMDLGVKGEAALLAFNVRGKLLNPGGLTVENAQKMIDRLRDDLGPDRFLALENAGKKLRDLLHDTQRKMKDEGLISKKTWEELIEPNKDNYLPYAVLDYFEGRVRAGVMPQKGTAKDIADIAAATQLKVASSNVWRQQQRQTQLIRDAYAAGGQPIPVGERLKRSRDIDRIREKHANDDVSRAVLWVDGKPHLVEFPGDAGKMLEKAMATPSFYEHIEWINEASDLTHKVMQVYTQFSVPFLFWRNPVRGARTAALKTGFLNVGRQLKPAELAENLKLAKNYADAAFGGEMLPEVRDLVDRQVLLPPRLSQAMVRDSANLRDLLANHTILANQIRGLRPETQPSWWKGGALGRKAIRISEKTFSGYEAFEKIYNYKAALERGMTPEQATAIARRAGIPKPGVGGKWSLAMEVWFPWTRVHIQGTRASYDMLRDPDLRRGFVTRFMLTEAAPRVAKVAIGTGVAAGVISWMIGPDEDPKDGVMAEFFRRVSPYKMALDDTVPLYFYDARTGKVHYLWEFKNGKSIPKHYEAVSMRIPASEEGRLWGILLYNMMISAPGAKENLGRPGENLASNMGNWAVNYAAPGLSPIIETSSNLKDMILLGRNPKDAYRNQPAANEQMFDAGGVAKAEAIAGYTLNQLGSIGELAGVMAANFGLLDERALNALSKRLPGDSRAWNETVPFLKTALSHDNYAQYREEKIPQLEEERIRAKARLAMPSEVRGLYDFYYRNLRRKDKLTPSEKVQFGAASDFVQKVWGDLTVNGKPNPNSFYSKAAHAVGPDGSRDAKDTLQRDLNNAAAPYLARFKAWRRAATEPPPAPSSAGRAR